MPPLDQDSPLSKEPLGKSRKKSMKKPQGKEDVKRKDVEKLKGRSDAASTGCLTSPLSLGCSVNWMLELSRGDPVIKVLATPNEIWKACISSLDAKVAQGGGQSHALLALTLGKTHNYLQHGREDSGYLWKRSRQV
eukprot:594640-Amorphochlora_amoeboformis.AAC.1